MKQYGRQLIETDFKKDTLSIIMDYQKKTATGEGGGLELAQSDYEKGKISTLML